MRRFWEGTTRALGWTLSVFVDFDLRPSRWGFYCSWFRLHRGAQRWADSYTAMAIGFGLVHVSVEVSRAWEARDKVTTPAAPEPESPLSGVRHAVYFDAK